MTESGRKRKNYRSHFNTRFLPVVFRQGAGRCHWCNREVVMMRTLAPDSILRQDVNRVFWCDADGAERTARIATLDHLVPLREDGPNTLSNAVVACASCNRNRTQEPYKPERLICRRCGGAKKKRGKLCPACYQAARTSGRRSVGRQC